MAVESRSRIDRRRPRSTAASSLAPLSYLNTAGYKDFVSAPRRRASEPWPPARRPRRRPRSRRLEVAITAVLLLLLGLGARGLWQRGDERDTAHAASRQAREVVTPVAATPTPAIAFSFARFEADPALVAGAISAGVPTISGESAIVVDVNGKEVIYAKQPRKRQLMASTTKIMTGIVAVERAPLNLVITVPVEATQVEPNHMGIRAGEKLTVQELLYGAMLDSGNDAAEALAYGVGGGGASGRAQFVTWMNEKAAALGLQDTRYANPSGLDDPNQYSTAYDLAVIGTYALGLPELRKIYSAKDIVIHPSREPGREHGWFNPGNLNSLLWSYRGAFGIKPGYTEAAGYTLVAAAERDGRTLIAVTLNSRRHFSDAAALLDFGFRRLS